MTDDLELFEAFFQKSKPYYLDKLIKYRRGEKISFNIFAFLFGLFWFMYRKMYFEALVVVVAIVVEGFLETLILKNNTEQDIGNIVNVLATIVIATIVGFVGNYLYMRKAEKIIQNAKKKYSDNEQLKIYLTKKGGVSFTFLIIICVVVILFFAYNNYMTNNGS